MGERATVFQTTQLGIESTPGQATTANKLLLALSIEPAIKAEISTFAPPGGKFATISALGKEWVEAKISSDIACYNHLAYLLSSALAYAAPVKQGSTNAYKWTFTPGQSSEDSVKTFTVEQGSGVRAGKFTYGLVKDLTLSFNREKIDVSGTMLGQAYQDGITMTTSSTAVIPVPILPTQLDVFLDDTSAALGTTKLLRALSGEFSLSDRFGPLWAINSEVDGFTAHVETRPTARLKLFVEADQQGMGLLTAMRAGGKRYVRIRAVGPTIADTYTYEFQLDFCGAVSEVGEFSDEDGVYAIEWTLDAAYDSVWGKALTVEIINTVSAL